MAEHHASVEVQAPAHQVYTMFTHFNDFPKFMRFIKEVTYYDDQRSHWVAQIAGQHEWDAINEDWIPDRQVGWRSIRRLENSGRVAFQQVGPNRTRIDVFLSYNPPAGKIGDFVETLGVNTHFDEALQQDLERFARMVEQAPSSAEDPMASPYLFHEESAAKAGKLTEQQQASMSNDPMMSQQAFQERAQMLAREAQNLQQTKSEQQAHQERQAQLQQQSEQEMQAALQWQAESEQQAQRQSKPEEQHPNVPPSTLGGRGADIANTSFGDLDARLQRYPGYERDEMQARRTHIEGQEENPAIENPDVRESEDASPWTSKQQREEG